MHIYAYLFKSNKKCYFSISQRILILFVLSDRALWGLRKFYTELWNSLIMQIYANLFKINEKCRLSSIQKSQQICTIEAGTYTHRIIYYTLVHSVPSFLEIIDRKCCILFGPPCIKKYFWSYDQKYYKFSYYFLYISYFKCFIKKITLIVHCIPHTKGRLYTLYM